MTLLECGHALEVIGLPRARRLEKFIEPIEQEDSECVATPVHQLRPRKILARGRAEGVFSLCLYVDFGRHFAECCTDHEKVSVW